MNSESAEHAEATRQPASLTAVMQAQLKALTRIEDILERERVALEERDADGLLAVAEAKNDALADLGDLERKRKALSASLDDSHLAELRLIAGRCRQMNSRNAALLNTQQQHVSRLLSLLRGGADYRPAGYDASGRAASATGQIRLTQV